VHVTQLPDGAEIVAATTDDQHELAAQLGYDSPDAMNAEHDPTHLALCTALGLSTSPTLDRVTHGPGRCSDDLRAYEEAMVLAAQQFMNAARAERWL
jgi:hypothetical protein